MSRMKIQAGWTVTSPEIIFPIYDLRPEEYTISSINTYSNDYIDGTVRSIAFTVSDPLNLDKLFPANIPRLCTDDGNINTVDIKFTEDANGHFVIADTTFGAPITAQPDDWGVNRYNYYTQTLNYGNRYLYLNSEPSSTRTGFTPNYAETPFPSGRVFYKNDSADIRKNLTQIYRTANGSTFGVSKFIHYGGNNTRWQKWILAGAAPFNDATNPQNEMSGYSWYWCPYGHTSGSDFTGKPRAIYDNTVSSQEDTVTFNVLTIFVTMNYNGVRYTGVALVRMSGVPVEGQPDPTPSRISCVLFDDNFWGESIISGGGSSGNWGPETTFDGGDGSFNDTSQNRGTGGTDDVREELASVISNMNEVFAGGGGFCIHQILNTRTVISDLFSVLYSTNFLMRFAQAMYDPLSAVLSLHLIPNNLWTAKGVSSDITASGYNVSANMTGSTKQFPEVAPVTVKHIGKISMEKFFGAFPDFAPYTECILHLPFVGAIKLDTNAIAHGELAVDYACDAASGNVMVWVWCKDKDGNCTFKYTASGNCAYHIPLIGRNNNGFDLGKVIGGIANTIFLAETGNEIAAGMTAIKTGISANPFFKPKSTLVQGEFGGNVGLLGDTKVWLEIIRPVWVQPELYADDKAIPAEISGTLEELGVNGFVQISGIDIESINATEAEKEELRQILTDGFWYTAE